MGCFYYWLVMGSILGFDAGLWILRGFLIDGLFGSVGIGLLTEKLLNKKLA